MTKLNPWHEQRDAQIVASILAGAEAGVVARQHRLTQARVRQIVREALPDGPWPWQNAVHRKVYTRELAEACTTRWEAGETYQQIARDVGVSPATVMNWVHGIRHERADQANTRAWKEELTESERYQVNCLLFDALHLKDWSLVEQARDVIGDTAFAVYEHVQKRGWKPE